VPGRPGPLADGSADRATGYPANTAGLISLTEGPAGWVVGNHRLYARVTDALEVPLASILASEGECEIWVHPFLPFGCQQGCAVGYCIAENRCVPFPEPADHGEITVSGLLAPVRFMSLPYGYIAEPEEVPEELFADDAVVKVTAAGGDRPGFTLEAEGVPALEAEIDVEGREDLLRIEDGVDEVIQWRAERTGRIQVALVIGHHGSPYEAMLVCETDDDGELVIPGSLIAQFPHEETGLGQHPSWIARFSRALVETDAGPIELFISSRAIINGLIHP
jgi:hypothetical protein